MNSEKNGQKSRLEDNSLYKLVYIIIYSLILIGEFVRKTIIFFSKVIGRVAYFIVEFLINCYFNTNQFLKSKLKTVSVLISDTICNLRLKVKQQILKAFYFIKQIRIPRLPLQKAKPKEILVTGIDDAAFKRRARLQVPYLQAMKWFVLGGVSALVLFIVPYIMLSWLNQLPNPQSLSYMKFPTTTKFYDRNEKLLYELYAEVDRQPISLAAIPQVVIDATIAIEDQEFYRHLGFSPRGIVRAARETFLKHDLQGGSTITQQLIKNTLLTPEPTVRRKIKELVLAFWAERIYSKDEILEMYLNNVPYGGTAWGIKAASSKYFHKPVEDLTLAEAALLAGLPAAPTTYSPFGARPELARQRQWLVLQKMREQGFISDEEEYRAKNEELNINSLPHNIKAAHFVMYVKQQLEQILGPRLVEQGGLQIKTTIDINLQDKVQQIVREELAKIAHMNVGNAAVLITKPKTGEILAMVGSRDYFDRERDGNVNIVTTLQQPGSSIKVVNYAAALQNGFTAATIISDSPVSFPQLSGRPYKPVNYDGRFHGLVPLRWALANSYNIPAVKVLNKIGVSTMISQGKLMGIDTWEDEARFGLALTLGGGEVTMLDMAEVYGVLANGGKRVDTTYVINVADFQGNNIEGDLVSSESVDVLPEAIAFILSDILADNIARTPAFGPRSLLYIPGKHVSVKTGTSDNKRDNWTIGYTKDYVVVVWVGNNDNSPMHPTLTSGVTGAAPIWRRVMDHLLEDREVPIPPIPEGVVKLPCYGRYEYFVVGTEPPNGCPPWPVKTPTPTPTPNND